jgi:hypothetical protein
MMHVKLADPQSHGDVTVFPLVTDGPASLPYLLLADALDKGVLRIKEVGQGTVPTLLAVNDADQAVLVLDGEQLVGAKQNRMTNRSILLPARSETRVPVSCMEQGRWHLDSVRFRKSDLHSPSKVRRKARDRERVIVARGLEPAPEHLSQAQGDVWDAVRELSYDLGVHSPTGALDELQRSRGTDIDRMSREYPAVDGQVGLLILLGTAPLGTDVVGSVAHYRRLHPRLLRGYLMDALSSGARGRGPRSGRRGGEPQAGARAPDAGGAGTDRAAGQTGPGGAAGAARGDRPDAAALNDAADHFLALVRDAERIAAPTVGLGDYSVLSSGATGAELVHDGRMVHLSGFPEEDVGRSADEDTWATSRRPFIRRRTGPQQS